MNRVIRFSYFFVVAALFLYSFTQVDLSLAISHSSFLLSIEKAFQNIGFFHRPFSATLFVLILILMFLYYIYFMRLAYLRKLTAKQVGILIGGTFLILLFSYNAFSYDLFNYIFDAKIITHYQLNPYLHRAMDFSGDPMLSFMRWTHRYYPYGPTWLALTVPLSFAAFNKFIANFFLFKILIALTYLGSAYLIYKISEILFEKDKVFNTVFFALNPLILIEGLVSSHNDFPLIFFGLLSIYFFVRKRKVLSLVSLVLSIGVKFSTVILAPILLYVQIQQFKKKSVDWERLLIWSVILSLGITVAVTFRTTFQPWYLVLPLSLASLLSKKIYILVPAILGSVFALSLYVVLVFMTDYSPDYVSLVTTIEWIGLVIASLSFVGLIIKDKKSPKLV